MTLPWLVIAGCSADSGGSEAPVRTVERLVDPTLRAGAESQPSQMKTTRPGIHGWEAIDLHRPTATIQGDTRPVLATIEIGPRRFERGVEPDAHGDLVVRVPSNAFTASGPFVVVVKVRDGATPTAASRALPGRLVAAGTTELAVRLPEAWRAPTLDVYVETFRAPTGATTRYETPPLTIPTEAELELAFGVLEAAAEQGPVTFAVEGCDVGGCEPVFGETLDPSGESGAGWQRVRRPLTALAGREVRLRFTASLDAPAGASGSGFTLPVFADPRIVAPDASASELPSIVLLSIDTLRADHLGLYGYPRATAPFVSGELGPGGVVFDTLVSAATTTGPSHMTMFTSLPPSVHRVAGSHRAMATAVPTLASKLRGAGYETAAFTDDGALDHERGFGLGFDRFFENKNARAMQTGQIELTFERALEYVDIVGDRPFFLFLHSFQVHDPYTPPPRYGKLFAADAMAPAPGQPGPVRAARALMADYDREIRYVDDELALFVAALEARGFFEHGLLVVTSDHGEAFFEHGRQGHGGKPHEELLHAPLVFYGEGVDRGRRVPSAVHHADLMPTLLEWAGVESTTPAVGRSFASMLRPASPEQGGSERADRTLTSEAWGRFVGVEAPALAARLGRYKMLKTETGSGPVYELFDLERDGRERQDLIGAPQTSDTPGLDAARAALRAALDEHEALSEALARELGAGAAPDGGAPLPIDPDREAKLRALGYIE